jgi:chromate transporter
MAKVSWQLGRTSLVDVVTLGLAIVSTVALFRWRLSSVWLILVGGMAGLLARAVHHGL